MESPTSDDLRIIANTEKLISDKDLEEKNDELNEFLSDNSTNVSPSNNFNYKNTDVINNIINQEINNIQEDDKPEIANHTVNLSGNDETINPPEELDDYQRASPQEKDRMKFNLLRKLARLHQQHNVVLYKTFSLKDDYYDMKREYEYQTAERAKQYKVMKYTKVTISTINFLEKISQQFSIFNNSLINLSGWGAQVELQREELACIIEELYEKYCMGPTQMSPEKRFLILILTSALYANFSNITSQNISFGLFGNNKQNIEDIEIAVTKDSLLNQNLNQNNQQPVKSDQEIFNQIHEDVSRASNLYKQQLESQQIRKGNYDINDRYKNELINRGLEKTYNQQNQPELEQPDLNDVPSIVAMTVEKDDSEEKKKKPKFRTSKKNKN